MILHKIFFLLILIALINCNPVTDMFHKRLNLSLFKKISKCLARSNIEYRCLLINFKILVVDPFSRLTPLIFIGPTLAVANLFYLTTYYLPYLFTDFLCFVGSVKSAENDAKNLTNLYLDYYSMKL